jgi:26S proteasome regulatory subunit N13
MSSALFGASTQARSKNLVEFKAGKMILQGKLVKPDKRKGLIYVYQSDDSIMHFCWKDRNTGIVEEDLMIFPGKLSSLIYLKNIIIKKSRFKDDIEYKRIIQCTTGRVFLMKFKSTNRKLFFWMQVSNV